MEGMPKTEMGLSSRLTKDFEISGIASASCYCCNNLL